MNAKKLILVAACGVCALVVFVMLQRMNQPAPEPVVQTQPQEVIQVVETPMSHILVVAADLPYGHQISSEDLQWQKWPDEAIGLGYIDQDSYPDAIERFSTSVSRRELLEGEPLTERKVVFPGDGGIMPALLTPGMRAVSVLISPETASGGFITPNDRVDVLITVETNTNVGSQFGGQSSFSTTTVLENVRVLAIDQMMGSIEGQPAIIGSTATLELSPLDAELVTRSQALGELALSLRSIRDADGQVNSSANVKRRQTESGQTVTIIRGGKRSQAMVGGGR